MSPTILDICYLLGLSPISDPFTSNYPNPPISFTIPSLNSCFSDFRIMPEFASLAKALVSKKKKKIALAPYVLGHCKAILPMEKNMPGFFSILRASLITSPSSIYFQFLLFPPSSAPSKLTQGQPG
ncbi:hypothetical protein CsSME_00033596 [Camellia sinensis var. sinensis]